MEAVAVLSLGVVASQPVVEVEGEVSTTKAAGSAIRRQGRHRQKADRQRRQK